MRTEMTRKDEML